MIERDSSGFLVIGGRTLQQIFGTSSDDASANPVRIQVTQETVHDDAERSQSGDMPDEFPTVINRKAKITATWNKIRVEWLGRLMSELGCVYKSDSGFSNIQNISVSYIDLTGGLRSMNCYVGATIAGQYVVDVAGDDYWDGVQVSFIEK